LGGGAGLGDVVEGGGKGGRGRGVREEGGGGGEGGGGEIGGEDKECKVWATGRVGGGEGGGVVSE